MMKKVVVVLVVLAMTQVASAAMLDLWITSLNGAPIDAVKEITIQPSDTINFDIVLTGAPAEGGLFSMDVDITATGPGTLDVSELTEGDAGWVAAYNAELAVMDGYQIIRVNDSSPQPADPELLVLDHILLHCDGEGQVIISLSENGTAGGTWLVDAGFNIIGAPDFGAPLIVNQIPEPATMLLLGLGGLFLRRRK